MPLGAYRLNGLARFVLVAEAEVIRRKVSVSAIGNAQVDTAQSKFGGSSALFDGTGDYLLISEIDEMNFSTNDFTIEAWIRLNVTNITQVIWDQRPLGSAFRQPGLYINSTNKLAFYHGTAAVITGTTNLTTGVWYHASVSRSSGSTKLFLNGTQEGSTYTDSNDYNSGDPCIGCNSRDRNQFFNGHIDEVRISNMARYTANFTSSTTPFVNDQNTLLLLHMDGTDASTVFEDDVGVRNKLGIRAINNAQVDTAQSKFGGSSALFDGTDDYIQTVEDNVFNTGTGDWTYECWFRGASFATSNILIDNRNSTSVSQANNRGIFRVRLSQINFSDGAVNLNGTTTLSTNTWYHYACTHSGGTVKIYLNGTLENTGTYSSLNFSANHRITVGAAYSAADDFNGHIDEVRISSTVRYTSNFTPSTTPFVNDADTIFLCHADGTDASTFFEDDNGNRAKCSIIPAGNASVTTSQSKFGGRSLYLDGNGDYLIISQTPTVDLSGDFTFEAWVYTLSTDGNFRGLWDTRDTSGSVLADEILMDIQSGGWRVFVDGTDRSTATLSTNTWYHVALVRNGTNFKFFIDGVQDFSYNAASVKDYTMAYDWWIGNKKPQPTNYWYGYIDEVRISSTARYTAGFTPSTTSFQNDSNTLLLIHADGTSGSTTFTDDNGVPPDYEY